MLDIALATIRIRWVSFAGALVALCLGTAMISMMALALASTTGTPFPGPQRFAAAQTVVVPRDPNGDAEPPPATLPATVVARARAAGTTVVDRTFPAPWAGGPSDAVGHAWSSAALTPYQLIAGHAPAAPDQVVVGSGAGARIGEALTIQTPLGPARYVVVGVVGQKWFEDPVFFANAVAAHLSPGANALAVAADADVVQHAVGNGPMVLSGSALQQADPDPTGGSDELLNAQAMAATTGAIAVCVAMFIVFATFAFVVEQRSREMALLRLIGATPRQIRQMVRAESLLIGLAGTVTGCALGCIGARWLSQWMISNGIAPSWFHISVNPVPLLIAAALGIAAAVLGAAAVALRASRVRPVDALREATADSKRLSMLRVALGVALFAAAIIAGYYIATDSPQYAVNPRKYAIVPLLFVGGFALLAPLLQRPIAWLGTRPFTGVAAGPLIVRQNTLNARRRTAAMVTPVAVAVGLVVAMMCMEGAASYAKAEQGRQSTHAQYVVAPAVGSTLSPAATAAIRSLPGVTTTTVADERIYIGADGQVLDTLNGQAVPPAALGTALTPRVLQGSLRNLDRNFIVVDERTAQEDGLSLGEQLTVWLPDGSHTTLRIAAIIQTGLGGDDTYLSADIPVAGTEPSLAWLTLRPGTSPATLATALRNQPVQIASEAAYFDHAQARLQAQTRTAALVILGISVGYSLIAVANTLIIAAAGRRREFALLSMAGATRPQILRIVAAESLLAVAVGTLIAAASGLGVNAVQRLSLRQLIIHPPVVVPWADTWRAVSLCAAVAVAAAVLSAWSIMQSSTIAAVASRE